MGWFKRRVREDNGASLEMVAEKIAGRILNWQALFSAKLNAKARRYNPKTILVVMIGFGLVFAGYCLWLVTSLFR